MNDANHPQLPTHLFAGLSVKEAALMGDLLQAEFEAYGREQAFRAVEVLLRANFGELMGAALYADLYGLADASNSALVGGTVSRAAVSKAACRIRRGLGLPLRDPRKARPKKRPTTPAPADDPFKTTNP